MSNNHAWNVTTESTLYLIELYVIECGGSNLMSKDIYPKEVFKPNDENDRLLGKDN